MQRAAAVTQEDAREPQSQEQEAQRKCQRTHDRPAPAYVCAVVSHDPHAEQCHADGPAARGPGMGEVDERPDGIGDHHPDVAPVPGDVRARQHPRRERDGGQGKHEDAETDRHVHGEADKTRGEARVLPLQALADDDRGPGGRGSVRMRSHGAAPGRSRSGGPGGPGGPV
jgi:hypothetical protein